MPIKKEELGKLNVEYAGYAGSVVALIVPLIKEIGGKFIPFPGEEAEILKKWDLGSEESAKANITIQSGIIPPAQTILLPYHGIQKIFPIEKFSFVVSRWSSFPEEVPHVQAGVLALDRFFNGNVPSKKELLEPLGLESSEFTIVYALAWKERKDASSSARKMESWISHLPPEVNLIIINHPLYKYNPGFREELMSIKQGKNMRVIYDQKDTFEWLNIADLIVCDSGSAIVLNTPCFKAPVLQIRYPYHYHLGYDYSWAVEVGPEEIPDRIFTDFMGNRKVAIEEYLYKFDGKATERAVKGIREFLEELEK